MHPEISKSQAIRLVDVYFIAPYLMWIGFRAKGLTKIERRILQGIAVSTLVYNARNYALNKRAAGEISEPPQTE
tara:strand:+ start:3123 stop:3344 length:222 start_codon:yes stop_codon:yes gene_type:complete